ncbi:MAG: M23 family metallopeptidase [Lachnospiraceae bacterium]|nr:M23 family metallopeptidase [Lachnospiraceae bacterium]
MKKQIGIRLLILTAMVCFLTIFTEHIQQTARLTHLLVKEDTKELLRQQKIPAEIYEKCCKYEKKSEYSRYAYLLGYLFMEKEEQSKSELEDYLNLLWKYQPSEMGELEQAEQAIWEDLTYFPVPLSVREETLTTSFENSWMFDREFGGNRGHEGTDLMASLNERGHYPIVSMTDGVVEKVGWLKLGGYRIGIRSPHGGYFYYAHLYDYAREFQEGDEIKAGELLGFMGDSGYGEKEGTVGMFAVHLHLGIYVKDGDEEYSVNPYWVLKWLEEKRLKYIY